MTRLMSLREWLWMGGEGEEKGLITRKRIKNTLLYLSPREVGLSGLHQRKLVIRHYVLRRHSLLHGPLLLQQLPESFVAFLVL